MGERPSRIGTVWRSLRRSVRGVASLPDHLRLLRQALADSREAEQAFHDAVLSRLAYVEAQAGPDAAEWLTQWDAIARTPLFSRGRLAALRALFANALARGAGTEPSRARPSVTAGTTAMTIEIAPGEVLDRMTILEIKLARIADEAKLRNVKHERDLLAPVESALPADRTLADLRAELKAVNEALWSIEDHIREQERAQDFGPKFIELARSVYRTNDRRAALKRRINEHLGSLIVEEKSYAPY